MTSVCDVRAEGHGKSNWLRYILWVGLNNDWYNYNITRWYLILLSHTGRCNVISRLNKDATKEFGVRLKNKITKDCMEIWE